MPIRPFNGDTFVGFIDIAGFKGIMADGDRGPLALDALYSAGYNVLRERHQDALQVDGMFVSDCGILFVHNSDRTPLERLSGLCLVVKDIHTRVFRKAVQLTTSIAWGEFAYTERIEFPGIGKNAILGNAYMDAFADSEATPKLYPGECRIRRGNLPTDVNDSLHERRGNIGMYCRETRKHFYYEWMRKP